MRTLVRPRRIRVMLGKEKRKVTETDREVATEAIRREGHSTDLVRPVRIVALGRKEVAEALWDEFGLRLDTLLGNRRGLRFIVVECGEGTYVVGHAAGVIGWQGNFPERYLDGQDDEDEEGGRDVGMHEAESTFEVCSDEEGDLYRNLHTLDTVGCATAPHRGHSD